MWQTKFGQCIYVSPSGCKVYENYLYRWFTFGSSALQTVLNRRAPQKPVLHYLPALTLMAQKFPGTCCLLGLGGGGVAHLLAAGDSTHPVIAVDNNAEVIQIARHYFMMDRIQNLSIVQENALNYVRNCSLQFHHLILDLYNANNYPAECSTDDFFFQCKRIVDKDGFIAINLANLQEQWPVFQLIKKHFKRTLIFPVKKCANMVIIASKNDSNDSFINQFYETGILKKIEWVQKWGYVCRD